MTTTAELARWRYLADRRLNPIEQIKEEILQIREEMDRKFAGWKAAYEANPADYLSHDARREYFVTLRTILQNAQLGFIYIRDYLANPDWWTELAGEFRETSVLQALREHALMIKFFSFHAIASATEETCRAIVRADENNFRLDPAQNFYNIRQRLLKLTGCKQYRDLFEVMQLTRNTIHTNGVYRPEKPKNRTISYGGRTFKFEIGTTLDWMGDDFSEWLASEISCAMECIVQSKIVSQIPRCPRGNSV